MKSNPKFRIGDKVHCKSLPKALWVFDFVGHVLDRNNTGLITKRIGPSPWEYTVSNAPEIFPGVPLLMWERQIVEVINAA